MDKSILSVSEHDALPGWVIDRAAVYMMHRYGAAALKRAASRRRFLLRTGDELAADHWKRVAAAIAALAKHRASPVEIL